VKQIGLVLLLMFGGSLAGIYYIWHEATKVPDWVSKTPPQMSPNVQQTQTNLERRIQAQVRQSQVPQTIAQVTPLPIALPSAPQSAPQPIEKPKVEVKVSSSELNDLIAAKVTDQSKGNSLPKSVKGFHTAVENETLKTGAIVDMKELQSSNLGAKDQELVSKIAQNFPMLGQQDVYIGVSGKPKVQDGKLKFDRDTKVQIGNLSLTVDEIAARLGISPEQVQEKLNMQFQLQGLDLKDIELQNGTATLRGTPKAESSPTQP
jgi:hypothetical protein